jgi:hypothetical protein
MKSEVMAVVDGRSVGPRRRVALAWAVALFAALTIPQAAAANPAYLWPGDALSAGQAISTGQFRLVMQYDGNLVAYNQAGRPLWASNTSCTCYAAMQRDGNLVLYRYRIPGLLPLYGAVWASGTVGQPGAYVVLQDDGNLVIKRGATPVWATGTVYSKLYAPDYLSRGHNLVSPNGRYRFVMQTDGNAVLYNQATRRAIWATDTVGRGYRFAMQRDGNLVLYTASGGVVWTSRTAGYGGSYLNLQNDGNLVLYQGSRAIWATNTQGR